MDIDDDDEDKLSKDWDDDDRHTVELNNIDLDDVINDVVASTPSDDDEFHDDNTTKIVDIVYT